ncbi:MAG: helix-turn-helix transcriptional regulator [Muribaculaceae bacterium]|nr:helix-turn-helix transcriptional regulator [Muribaculaceae bacterium]
MDIVDRLKLFMSQLGMSSSQLADTASIPRPTLSQIITGRNKKISNEIFSKLHDAFPELNMMWLMFGDGQMTNDYIPRNDTINLKTPNSTDNHSSLFDIDMSDELISNNQVRHHSELKKMQQKGGTSNGMTSPGIMSSDVISGIINAEITQSNKESLPIAENAQSTAKNIVSIMVFYDDNSFETFYPSKQ